MHEVKPEQPLIDRLEELLDIAKKGEINGIAYVLTYPGEYVGNAWVGMNKCNMNVIGELRVLERDLLDSLIALRVDPRTGEEH